MSRTDDDWVDEINKLERELSDARAALREIQRRTDGVTDIGWDGLNNLRVLLAAALADTTAPVAVPTTDPVQDIQREGSITHADLMAVRERYGALYAAVFPLVPRIVESYCDSHRDIDGEHARICLAQIKACK